MPLICPTITVYTKPNCPLCDEALEQLESARQKQPFTLVEVNILTNLDLYESYKHRIPVISLNGVELFRYRLTQAELLARLREII